MKTLAHLLDDPNVGGVTRGLVSQMENMTANYICRRVIVDPARAFPPAVTDDIAIIHYTPSWRKLPFLALLRAQRPNAAIIHVEHSYTESFERIHVHNRGRFRRMLKMTYSLCDTVVAVSHGQARWLSATGIVPPSKLATIRSTADNSHLSVLPLPRREDGPLRLCAYGRYCEQKGFDTLVEAMKRIPSEVATLTLGGYGPDEAQLRTLARGVPNVEVRGLVTDLAAFLAEFHAVVVPSRFEAFGQVAVEARTAGRPVIATAVDGLPEQISKEAGILAEHCEAGALSAAIFELANRDITAMGRAARESAGGHFETHLAQWKQLIECASRDRAATSVAHAA